MRAWFSGRTLAQDEENSRLEADRNAARQAEAAAAAARTAEAQAIARRSVILIDLRPSQPGGASRPSLPPAAARTPAAPREAAQEPPAAPPMLDSEGARTVVQTGSSDGVRALLAALLVSAERLEREYGIPRAAVMAMALHEGCRWDGQKYTVSQLAQRHHNFFGMKIGKAMGDFVTMPTRELGRVVHADFRAYQSIEAGISGFGDFLKYARYRPAFAARDARGFVRALLKAGYCPEPDYMPCIEEIFRRHQLDAIDTPPSSYAHR